MVINQIDKPMRDELALKPSTKVALCRCWRSKKFPYCDGSHRQLNEETGDQVGPIVINVETTDENT